MLHFGMDMPFILMMLYGSLMILIVLFFRILLKKKLPKFVFPILWCVVIARLLIPFSLSSPLSVKASEDSFLLTLSDTLNAFAENTANVAEDATEAAVGTMTLQALPSKTATSTTQIEDFVYSSPTTAGIQIQKDLGGFVSFLTYDLAEGYGKTGDVPLLPAILENIPLRIIYLTGLLLTLSILLFQKYHYSARLKNSLPVEHNETVNTLLRNRNMGHIPVFTNDEITSPLTCGLFAPRIYLPTRMDFGNRELLRHILMHETMHIRRKDNWVKAFMLAALILNWFNPLVWVMAKCLASDLESACDEAVLRQYHDEDERKNYAFSLLTMAITGSRAPLFYSAFSKTEVEKRIQNILHYKKAPALLLTVAILFLTCSTVAFATGAPAPFSPDLTSSCASDSSRWGVKVYTTRSLTLGKDAQDRAESIIFDVLRSDTDSDPVRMDEEICSALSDEFHVEKNAFRTDFFLCLNEEEQNAEYASWELVRDERGFFQYKGDPVRIFVDQMLHSIHARSDGVVDVTVERDRFGFISGITALPANTKN
ncbi:MAG: hypothetical protein NC416_18060 [Eubacterium sp.]|nr:hypothetical protein [Eubacterium sp.]